MENKNHSEYVELIKELTCDLGKILSDFIENNKNLDAPVLFNISVESLCHIIAKHMYWFRGPDFVLHERRQSIDELAERAKKLLLSYEDNFCEHCVGHDNPKH